MKLNIKDYRACKQSCVNAYAKGGINELSFQISMIGCPLVAACYYCAEEFGMTEDLQEKITRLTKFYGYSTIEGYKEKE